MKSSVHFEAHFYTRNEVAFCFDYNSAEKSPQFLEALLMLLYSMQTLCELYPRNHSDLEDFLATIIADDIYDFHETIKNNDIKIVDYASKKGKVRVVTDLVYALNQPASINIQTKGFWLTGQKYSYYRKASVIMMIGYFLKKNESDSDFFNKVERLFKLLRQYDDFSNPQPLLMELPIAAQDIFTNLNQ